ncbi:MAG: ABC transporter ATP-binding protein/permease [Roseburia sp.]|nr:ABC transporter ATP-binding protein/permease [Roseburia sp.]
MSDFQVLKKLYALYYKNNRKSVYVCLITAVLAGIKPYILPVLSSVLIGGLVSGADFKTLAGYIAIGLAVNFVVGAAEAKGRESLNASIENCLERENRDLNEISMQIDYENLENKEKQEKKRRHEQLVNAQGGIYWMLILPLNRGMSAVVSIITTMVVALPMFLSGGEAAGLWGSLVSAALMAAVIGLCIFGANKISIMASKTGHRYFDRYTDVSKLLNYITHNILSRSETEKDLRIFAQEDMIKETCFAKGKEADRYLSKCRKVFMFQEACQKSLSDFCLIAVYVYVAVRAYMGYISISDVVLYAGAIVKCIDALQNLSTAIARWNRVIQFGRDYLDYLDFDNLQYKGTLPVEKRRDNRFLLEFDHVSFKYPESDTYVIKDLSLTLDIGGRMAIVGKNGSGKTTFIKLICRLYDVTEGEIRLNGVDIRKYNYDEYMRLMSVVFQDYRVFALQLGENIAASEAVDGERAVSAVERAGLGERFRTLEDGLETYVGKEFESGGVLFSGGERQKVAIARAIYKNAPFVIMDEPTAALDPISECEVYAGFDKMVDTKTAMYISHRLASCRFCEDILVFDGGRIVQRGSHDTLVGENGLYRMLWNAQAKYYA